MDELFKMTDKEFAEFKERIKNLDFTDEETDEGESEEKKVDNEGGVGEKGKRTGRVGGNGE
jgi:hypothetical protein